jgi:hypothetical protein
MRFLPARLLHAVLPALILAGCGTEPVAPSAVGGPPAARSTSTSYSVSLSAPLQVYQESDITLTATASPSGSYYYNWYEKWCSNGSAPNDCVYQFQPTFEGQNLSTVTEHVFDRDIYVDYKVEIRAYQGGPLLAARTRRVNGPQFGGGSCGGGTPC